jgi:hypothetical protein
MAVPGMLHPGAGTQSWASSCSSASLSARRACIVCLHDCWMCALHADSCSNTCKAGQRHDMAAWNLCTIQLPEHASCCLCKQAGCVVLRQRAACAGYGRTLFGGWPSVGQRDIGHAWISGTLAAHAGLRRCALDLCTMVYRALLIIEAVAGCRSGRGPK